MTTTLIFIKRIIACIKWIVACIFALFFLITLFSLMVLVIQELVIPFWPLFKEFKFLNPFF